MNDTRLSLAEAFLREAVYRSRASQAATTALKQSASPGVGTCGLGERAAIVLDLSPRGRELFEALWSDAIDERELERIRGVTAAWIARQDALDRKRNHFLKAFRGRHGFDRTAYAPEILAEFEAGLAKVASEEDAARRRRAEALADS